MNKILDIAIIIIIILILYKKKTEHYSASKKYEFLIISFGGGGTTYLMHNLHDIKKLNTNSPYDYDGLKHISYNRLDKLNKVNCDKILFLFNDPLLAIESHFRRDFKDRQLKKLGDPHGIGDIVLDKTKYHNEVIKQGKDLYGCKEQFEFFAQNNKINKSVMFIDFNSIPKYKYKIAKYLKINVSLLDDISVKKRHSNHDKNNIDDNYKKIYKSLYDEMKKYDGVIVRKK